MFNDDDPPVLEVYTRNKSPSEVMASASRSIEATFNLHPLFVTTSSPSDLTRHHHACHNTPYQVPLDSLVDSRCIEGTYPLFDSSCPENVEGESADGKDNNGSARRQDQHNQRRRTSSCFGGLFDPSLELGVHLYRMGPLNNYRTADRSARNAATSEIMVRSSGVAAERARTAAPDRSATNDGDEARSGGGGQGSDPSPPARLWKPPSLVERGKVGLDERGSSAVSLFARPQMEARRAGDTTTSSGGEGAGG